MTPDTTRHRAAPYSPSSLDAPPSRPLPFMILRSALLLALAAASARAQQPVPPVAPHVPAPLPPALTITADTTIAPFERPNGALLRPGTAVYDLTSTRAGQATPLGVRTVQVSETMTAGMPAWLIAESRTGSAVETSDSLFLTRGALTPERWVAVSGRALLAASFVNDTVFGALQSYQGRSSFTAGVGASALVTPGMVERIVELLPLHAGYRAQASLVLIELGMPRAVPAELLVDHEEPLPLGDHSVDCWVVALRAGAAEERLWVTKDAPRVVKTEQLFAGGVLTATLRPEPAAAAPAVASPSAASPAAVSPAVATPAP